MISAEQFLLVLDGVFRGLRRQGIFQKTLIDAARAAALNRKAGFVVHFNKNDPFRHGKSLDGPAP